MANAESQGAPPPSCSLGEGRGGDSPLLEVRDSWPAPERPGYRLRVCAQRRML